MNPEETLKQAFDKHGVNYDNAEGRFPAYIDDGQRAFDAIYEAMESYAKEHLKNACK